MGRSMTICAPETDARPRADFFDRPFRTYLSSSPFPGTSYRATFKCPSGTREVGQPERSEVRGDWWLWVGWFLKMKSSQRKNKDRKHDTIDTKQLPSPRLEPPR